MADTVLIVDDEATHLRMAEYVIQHKLRYRTVALSSGAEAVEWLLSGKQPAPDLLLLDLILPDMDGLEVIRRIKAWNAQLPVIAVTPYGEHEQVAQASQAGANDFLSKPIVIDRLALSLQNALKIKRLSQYIARLERNTAGQIGLADVLSDAPAVKQAVALAEQAAKGGMPVWIEGEHGTGKELFARGIHGSGRANKPFIVVQCPELAARSGGGQTMLADAMAEAADGTLFFKEVASLDAAHQQVLLALLQTAGPRARCICSSSVSIDHAVQQGRFHPQLRQRLHGQAITLPALRERTGDIALLADYFLMLYALAENRTVYAIAPRALAWLESHLWPGNIRQLSELIRQAVRRCEGDTLDLDDLRGVRQERLQLATLSRPGAPAAQVSDADRALFLDAQGQLKKLKHIESEAIRFALQHSGGCMTRAAKSLGIGRSTLYRKMDGLGIVSTGHYISRANQTMRPII